MPLNICLVCSFGMSTSIIEAAVKDAAANQNLAIQIRSIGTGETKKFAAETDVFLLGPQVRYALSHISSLGKPVAIIDPFIYASSDGTQVLRQALALAGKEGRP